jgi:hypothetical protein
MSNVLEQIDKDLKQIKKIVEEGIKYPFENIEAIQKRIAINSQVVLNKNKVSVGEWCQVHIPSAEDVFYAKVKHISKDGFVVLVGIYNYSGENFQDRIPNSFPLGWVIPISEEIGQLLEYANKNNSMGRAL